MAEDRPPCPTFSFASPPSVADFKVPYQTYLSTRQTNYHHIATGAVVIVVERPQPDTQRESTPRILLLQRAGHDSMPHRWETPGGACDIDDESILHGVARELWEEAGLVARCVGPRVVDNNTGDDHVFRSRSGKVVCKFSFLVDVQSGLGLGLESEDAADAVAVKVRLDPNEHQRYLWVTEEEAREGRARTHEGGSVVELPFTTPEQRDVVLQGFTAWQERNARS